jgi:hypothetical protein
LLTPPIYDSSLVSVGLLVGNQGISRETCENQSVKVRGSPLVFAVVVTQLVTQPVHFGRFDFLES